MMHGTYAAPRNIARDNSAEVLPCISAPEFSEILIMAFALTEQLSRYVRRPHLRAAPSVPPSFRGPYVPLRWCPARARGDGGRLVREGPRVSCNFHRVGGYPLFRITGSLPRGTIAPVVPIERNDRALTMRELARDFSGPRTISRETAILELLVGKFRRQMLLTFKVKFVDYKSTRLRLSNERRARHKRQVNRIQLSLFPSETSRLDVGIYSLRNLFLYLFILLEFSSVFTGNL